MADIDFADRGTKGGIPIDSTGGRQFCAGCGANVSARAHSCWRCGRYFEIEQNASWRIYDSFYRIPALVDYRVGSPGKRVFASLIDLAVLLPVIALVEFSLVGALSVGLINLGTAIATFCLALFIVPFAYFCSFEASRLKGTPGKIAARLKVVDLSGRGITFGAAARRQATKWALIWPAVALIAVLAVVPLTDWLRQLLLGSAVILPGMLYLADVLLSTKNKDNRSQLDKWSGTLVGRAH